MLRVAGIAKLICDNWTEKINTNLVVNACLVHDLGNLLKFDLVNKANFLGPEVKNIEHWKKIKQEMTQKYGPDEHKATSAICKEIGIPPDVFWIVENWGFGNFEKVMKSDNLEYKICVYCDHRIGPFGIVSLEERFAEQRKRYEQQSHTSGDISAHLSDKEKHDKLVASAFEVEKQIQEKTKINLNSILDQDLSLEHASDFFSSKIPSAY